MACGLAFSFRCITLPNVADYLAVDDCKPAILLLLHLSKCYCNLLKFSLGPVVAVQDPLFVIALDRSICPKTTPLESH